MYLFSLRNSTRGLLQDIGSEKIELLALHDGWVFLHHFKTNIKFNFEEVIIL
jgi:hypothetical protein